MNEQRDLEGISALVTGASSGIGSMAGQVGLPGGAAYSATKGALAAMTHCWMRGTRGTRADSRRRPSRSPPHQDQPRPARQVRKA